MQDLRVYQFRTSDDSLTILTQHETYEFSLHIKRNELLMFTHCFSVIQNFWLVAHGLNAIQNFCVCPLTFLTGPQSLQIQNFWTSDSHWRSSLSYYTSGFRTYDPCLFLLVVARCFCLSFISLFIIFFYINIKNIKIFSF